MSSFDPSVNPQPAPVAAPSTTTLEAQRRNGANWYFWIAGLSIVNTVVHLSGGQGNFVIGLGLTLLISAFSTGLVQQADPQVALAVKAIAFCVCLAIAGVVAIFGVLARKGQNWAFPLGMFFYAIDGLIYLVFGDYMSFGFHIFALFCLFNGYKAARSLRAIESQAIAAPFAEPAS